jgi:D-glycero-alpha-D-manno-heptose-7-phosphate kinase
MIISRTPLRMSFAGGGSDLPSYYREHGGAVISTAIDKFIYVTVSEKFDSHIRVSYSRTEEVECVDQIAHPLVREGMKLSGVTDGIEITSVADIPAKGTGLGSSSSFTVGLLHALYAHRGLHVPAERLAAEACEIEIERCGEPIGKQDQYAAAYGGLSFIRFNQDDSVCVDPVICRRDTIREIEGQILVFYTGMTRSASALLKSQGEALATKADKQQTMARMVGLAYDLKREIEANRPDQFGAILHESWLLKRSISDNISNSRIDHWYEAARKAGATGGKILGAGSGGFLMLSVADEHKTAVRRSLQELKEVSFRFEPQGSKIIFVH